MTRPKPPGMRLSSVPVAGLASTPFPTLLKNHSPSRVTNIGTTSYFDGAIAPTTLVAERMETSCSAERPPNSTAMRSNLQPLMSPPFNTISIVSPIAVGLWRP